MKVSLALKDHGTLCGLSHGAGREYSMMGVWPAGKVRTSSGSGWGWGEPGSASPGPYAVSRGWLHSVTPVLQHRAILLT